MESIFNFNTQSSSYDDYYSTELGLAIDKSEKKCVKKFLDKITNKTILELGCGTGHWSEWISEQGFDVHGIDVAEKMLEKAESKNIPNSKFELMSMTDLKFEDESVDNIIAVTSIEFSIDLDKTFSEIKRVLKPNGYFIAAVLNSKSVIGINKKDNPTFVDANFFTLEELSLRLQTFGKPYFCNAAFLNDKFEIDLDLKTEPAMIVGCVKKNNK